MFHMPHYVFPINYVLLEQQGTIPSRDISAISRPRSQLDGAYQCASVRIGTIVWANGFGAGGYHSDREF
jgi:hypothetical protein